MTKFKKKNSFLYLFVVLIPLIMYAMADVQTSRMVGFKDADRSNVYLYLSLTMGLMILYVIFRVQFTNYFVGITKILWIMILWVSLVNVMKSPDVWSSIIHLSLGVWWIMSYLFFYTYKKINYNSNSSILFFFMVMYGFYVYATIFSSINITTNYDRDYAVLNYAYYILTLFPLMLLIEKKRIRNVLLVLTVLMVIFSLKRGPIIILPLMLLAKAFTDAKITNRKLSNLLWYVIISFFFIGLLFYINILTNNFLFSRFSEEELTSGSGRTEIYQLVIESLTQRDFIDLFVGSGSGSSVQLIGTGAHNEWLEFLYSFGIIGVILYFIFCTHLVKRYLLLLRQKNYMAPLYSMVVIYVLTVGLFGGLYFVHSSFYVFASLGFLEGSIYRSKSTRRQQEDNKTIFLTNKI